jgi:glutamyl/glutaminyl-tRNA synthetase
VARTSHLELTDFVPAYHWACSIDDYDERHTLIVRAWDLENSMAPQKQIFDLIASWEKPLPYPAVFHTSLVCSNNGHRLEKRTLGITLKELQQNGFNSASIIKCFERSFDFKLPPLSSSQPQGEKNKVLLLRDLLC